MEGERKKEGKQEVEQTSLPIFSVKSVKQFDTCEKTI